jgi:hypothetical protein
MQMPARWRPFLLLPAGIIATHLWTTQANATAFASVCSGFDEGGCSFSDSQTGVKSASASTVSGAVTVIGDTLSLHLSTYSTDPGLLRPLGGAHAQWTDSLTLSTGSVALGLNGVPDIVLTPLGSGSYFLSITEKIGSNVFLDGSHPSATKSLSYEIALGSHVFLLSTGQLPYASGGDFIGVNLGTFPGVGIDPDEIVATSITAFDLSRPVGLRLTVDATVLDGENIVFDDPLVFTVRDAQGNIVPNIFIQSASGASYSVTNGFAPPSGPTPTPIDVPEPSSALLLGMMCAGLGCAVLANAWTSPSKHLASR